MNSALTESDLKQMLSLGKDEALAPRTHRITGLCPNRLPVMVVGSPLLCAVNARPSQPAQAPNQDGRLCAM